MIQPYLKRLYKLWLRFSELLGHVNAWIIMSVLFFVVFTPAAGVLRLLGKKLLVKKPEPEAATYFIPQASGYSNMNTQF